MHEPYTQPELLVALEAGAAEVASFFSAIPAPAFFAGDDARWSPAHHIAHLAFSRKRIAAGFRAGAALAPNPGGRSRGFAETRRAYTAALAATPPGVLARNPMAPRMDPAMDRSGHVAEFSAAGLRLLEAARAWSDADLDARSMPHPFMGPISAREMLMFCIGHEAHHIEVVRRRLAESRAG